VPRISGTRNHAEMSDAEKPKDPWSDPDPQPGDFDAELDGAKPEQIEIHDGDPAAKLTMSSMHNP
jgi:hypothetical protein